MGMPDWCEAEEWCPITVTAELLGRKWHPVIIHRLIEGEKGFNELQRHVSGVSAKVLSESLEDLQEKEIIERRVIAEDPVQVEYSLTQRGSSLKPVIMSMKDWGESNHEAL